MLQEASKAGGSLAFGSCSNLSKQSFFKKIIPSHLSSYEYEARCYQRLNQNKKMKINIRQTVSSAFFLLAMMLKSNRMRFKLINNLKKLINQKGFGLMFCSVKKKSQAFEYVR